MKTDLKEVTKIIQAGDSVVRVECPNCGSLEQLNATSWPAINVDGVFIFSDVVTYGTTCKKCEQDFCFKPLKPL